MYPRTSSEPAADLAKNVCGVSVVDNSFEKLKRFNISEIFEPTPKEDNNQGQSEVADN